MALGFPVFLLETQLKAKTFLIGGNGNDSRLSESRLPGPTGPDA